MGYWFGKSRRCKPWRKTPTKIGNSWYTPSGQKIYNPKAYFNKVRQNGRYWQGNTGWDDPSPCDIDYDDYGDYDFDDDNWEDSYDNDLYRDGCEKTYDYDPDLDDMDYIQENYLGCF